MKTLKKKTKYPPGWALSADLGTSDSIKEHHSYGGTALTGWQTTSVANARLGPKRLELVSVCVASMCVVFTCNI